MFFADDASAAMKAPAHSAPKPAAPRPGAPGAPAKSAAPAAPTKPAAAPTKGPAPSAPPAKAPPPPPTRDGKKPPAFVVKKGEYFKGPQEEEKIVPLEEGGFSLPRSMVQEDEEKDLRKRFGKGDEDKVADIYERHGAVTVTSSGNADDQRGGGGRTGIVILVVVIAALAGAFAFRAQLRPRLENLGIPTGWLPK